MKSTCTIQSFDLSLQHQKITTMSTIKFSKAFGQVEVLSTDETFTTILVEKTGEVKKLLNKYANLSDVSFKKSATKKNSTRELTSEEIERLDFLKVTGCDLSSALKKSTANYRAGKSGLTSLIK